MFLGRRRRSGQATTEYILVPVLVAILSIGVITAFGNQLRDLFRVATERMGGISDSKLDASITNSAKAQVRQSMSSLKE